MAPLNELVRVSGGVYVLTEEWIDGYSLVSCHRFTIQLVSSQAHNYGASY